MINIYNLNKALKKSSNLFQTYRESVVGVN
jgi:hypothetical protein